MHPRVFLNPFNMSRCFLNYLHGVGIYLSNSQLCVRNRNPPGYRVIFSHNRTWLLLHITTGRLTEEALISTATLLNKSGSKPTLILHWIRCESCLYGQATFCTSKKKCIMCSNIFFLEKTFSVLQITLMGFSKIFFEGNLFLREQTAKNIFSLKNLQISS